MYVLFSEINLSLHESQEIQLLDFTKVPFVRIQALSYSDLLEMFFQLPRFVFINDIISQDLLEILEALKIGLINFSYLFIV